VDLVVGGAVPVFRRSCFVACVHNDV
jgi:hypothetical protein